MVRNSPDERLAHLVDVCIYSQNFTKNRYRNIRKIKSAECLQNILQLRPEIPLYYLHPNYFDAIFVNFLLYNIYSIKHIRLG
jgi:hypothetical protein